MKNYAMTDFTVGNIPRHLIAFSVPLLIGNLLQTFYNTVDSFWVGRFLGPDALGAVSVSFPVIFLLVAFAIGLGIAANIMVAQYLGAKKYEDVQATIANALFLFTFIGVFLTVVGMIIAPRILRLMNTPPEIFPMANSYLSIFLAGLTALFIYNAVSALLRGLGDSKTPLMLLVYSTIINIILDPLMIIGVPPFPKMGVGGAALATVIAQGFSGFVGVYYLQKREIVSLRRECLRWRKDLVRLMVKIGFPAGLQQIGVSIGLVILSTIVNSFGKDVVAAFGAAGRIDQFSFLPALSFGIAVSSITGQNFGARNFERSREVLRWGAILTGGISVIITVVVYFTSGSLIKIFTIDPEVIRLGTAYLHIVSLSYIPYALMFVYTGCIRGAGDTVMATIQTLFAFVLVRSVLAALLSHTPLAEKGIWISITVSSVVGLLLSLLYYNTGKWKSKIIIRESEEKNPETPSLVFTE